MGLRFTRRITIFPGVRLNLSKSGVSLSIGPRGASITLGKRGVYGNVGLPGTGLSYRTRLDAPVRDTGHRSLSYEDVSEPLGDSPREPASEYALARQWFENPLRDLLRTRERGAIDWEARARWLEEPAPDPDEDPDAFEEYARRVSQARFAKRMVAGDRAAWEEVIREEIVNEELPVDFAFSSWVDEDSGEIRIDVELPPPEIVEPLELPVMKARELYEDVSCAMLLRFTHEIYRVIPEADDVYISGYRPGRDPATGQPVREVYLRLATDRDNFSQVNLDHVDPSKAFEALGGAKKTKRGELLPVATEPDT